jgi:hypothetical protein
MKLRINQQSIRLRLSQNDIANLRLNSTVSVPLFWGMEEDDLLVYKLSIVEEGVSQVKIKAEEINIMILKNAIENWLKNDEVVSFECSFPTLSHPLKVLIERDFKCLTPRNENEGDLFENPNVKC